MLQTAQSAQPANLNQEISRLRSILDGNVKEARERLVKAEDGVKAAQAELEAARAVAASLEKQFNDFSATFPAPAVSAQKGMKSKPVLVGKNGTPAGKPSSGGKLALAPAKAKPTGKATGKAGGKVAIGRVVIKPLVTRASSDEPTVPERLAKAMGRHTWTAGDLQGELEKIGEVFNSNNLRSYLSTTLNSTMMNVATPNGDLRDGEGKLVKVHVFKAVERGQYRVAKTEDVQAEVKKLLGASEVIVGDSNASADQVFAEQGIDLGRAIPQH